MTADPGLVPTAPGADVSALWNHDNGAKIHVYKGWAG